MSITASDARKALFPLIKKVNDDHEAIEIVSKHGNAVLVSAETGEGLDELRAEIADSVKGSLIRVELLIPFDAGDRLSELHEVAGDLEREDRADGVLVRARLPAALAQRFADLDVNGRGARSPNGLPARG